MVKKSLIPEVVGLKFESDKMKILLFTFYYPPDLSAGSFRAVALIEALSKKISSEDELHVVTTHPNRYFSHKVIAKDNELNGNIKIHRVKVPSHNGGMVSQIRTFVVFAWYAMQYCSNLRPNFIIGTTSRLMTGLLAGFLAKIFRCKYFIDLRDIFSETISDLVLKKNALIGRITKIFFLLIEKFVLNNASGVNIVSEGFADYFRNQGFDTSKWSFFPNGIDQEFIEFESNKSGKLSSIKTILYAGNIGSGQGLELVLPEIAKKLGNDYIFKVIGDGGKRKLLEERVASMNIENIKLLLPINREELVQHYINADILFLHLNDLPAFKRVLPSKIFEYAAIGKPIVAGLSGYSAKFIQSNIEHALLFTPGDVNKCVDIIRGISNLKVNKEKNREFLEKFSRKRIMLEMADHLLTTASTDLALTEK
jgi:glycosyltransferase involved in cell wall biosynthesis